MSTPTAAPAAPSPVAASPAAPEAAPIEKKQEGQAATEAFSAEDIALEEQDISSRDASAAIKEPAKKEVAKAADKVGAEEVEGSKGELFTLKIDGEEVQMSKEEVVKMAQLGKVGQKRMQEYANYKKKVDSFLETLTNDPLSVLNDPDLKLTKEKRIELANKILSEQLEEESLSPAEKELREAKAELQAIRDAQKKEKEDRERQENEEHVSKFQEELQTQVQEAIEKTGLKRDARTLHKLSEVLLLAHDRNLKITPMQAAELVREEFKDDTRYYATQLSDEQLEELLGDETVTRLRKHSLKKLRSAVPSAKTKDIGQPEVPAKPIEKQSIKNFMKDYYKK